LITQENVQKKDVIAKVRKEGVDVSERGSGIGRAGERYWCQIFS